MMEAHKSPVCEKIPHRIPRIITPGRLRFTAAKCLTQSAYTVITSIVPSAPPAAPSTVFFGLIVGASLCFPNNIPLKYAQVSVIQLPMKIRNRFKSPCSVWRTPVM